MECTRCNGLMVTDNLIDIRESFLPMWMRGLRCVACGNVVDPIIVRNRMQQQLSAVGEVEPDVRVSTSHQHAKAA